MGSFGTGHQPSIRKRRAMLDALRDKLLSPQPPQKLPRPMKFHDAGWQVGDVLAVPDDEGGYDGLLVIGRSRTCVPYAASENSPFSYDLALLDWRGADTAGLAALAAQELPPGDLRLRIQAWPAQLVREAAGKLLPDEML